MRIVVLGGNGMLGHKVYQRLHARFETFISFRKILDDHTHNSFFPKLDRKHILEHIDALNIDRIGKVLKKINPDVIVNCIGIIKQRAEAKQTIPAITVNALFPHQLAELCGDIRARIIHLSTDCVFSGAKGQYSERNIPDPVDLYGRTKLLGELDQEGCLTLRTSMIGWEIRPGDSLLEWFGLQRHQTVKGFQQAIFSGVSTSVLADLIGFLIEERPGLSGLYHVAAQPISKYDLLDGLREALNWQDITIEPDKNFHCDRSLMGTRFFEATGWKAPEWSSMIEGLANEWPAYAKGRNEI